MVSKRMMAIAAGAAVGASALSAANAQITVFDNFGLGFDYTINSGWSVAGANSNNPFGIEQMASFVPTESGVLSDVWVAFLAVASDPDPDFITLRLVMDNGGLPGMVLEEWYITDLAEWNQWVMPIHLEGSGATYLHAGQTYWLWAQPDIETYAIWAFNNVSDTGPMTYRREGEFWLPVFWDTRGAFRVDVALVEPGAECPTDINGDGVVSVLDLLAVLSAWGNAGGPEDVNGDGQVDVLDLLEVLSTWGDCPGDPMGACCFPDYSCVEMTEYECLVAGPSFWIPGVDCLNAACPDYPIGACCIWPSGDCIVGTPYQCQMAGGIWQGPFTDCATVQCPVQPDPDFVVTAPYSSPWRDTCGAGNDCTLAQSDDHMYEVTIPQDGYWHFNLCSSMFDTYVLLGTDYCMSDAGWNDDACNGSLQSEIYVYLDAGVYYLDVEGYGGECGQYTLDIFLGVPPSGACCVGASCVATNTQAECDALGGTWYQGEDCATFVCPQLCPEATILVQIMTDDYPDETTWEVVDQATGAVVASGGPYPDPTTLYVHQVCVEWGNCFDFTIYDAYGDGICCAYGNGYYEVYFEGELVGTGGQFGTSETVFDIGDGCGVVTGACCVDQVCVATNTQDECDVLGGEWFGGQDCATFVCPDPCDASNGAADGENGSRPTAGWGAVGIIEDVVLTAPAVVSSIHSEFIDLTSPIGVPSTIPQQEFRIYDLAQGDGTLGGLDPATAVPLLTVVLTDGVNATKSICGGPFFESDVECWDGTFPDVTLPPGNYGLWFSFPGAGMMEYYFATGGEAPNASSPAMGHIWGMDGAQPVNEPAWWHFSFCVR